MFVFSVSLFGLLFAYRICFFQNEFLKKFSSQSLLAKIVTASFGFIKKYRCEREFEKQFLVFLNQLILFMRTGSSFRRSFRQSALQMRGETSKKLLEIEESVTFSQQNSSKKSSKFEKLVIRELIRVDRCPQNSLVMLLNWRKELKITSFFRHRSQQMTSAVRVQCGILCFLYISLLFFVVAEFSWIKNRLVVSTSMALFVFGLIVFFLYGRKSKWKL